LDLKTAAENQKLVDEKNELIAKQKQLQTGGLSAFDRTKDSFQGINDPARNSSYLKTGDGFFAGAMQWSEQLGSMGQQVAASIQSSIGATVSGISDGIYGWITGTQSWADTLRGIGASVLRTILGTIVQMGVQMLLNAALAPLLAARAAATSLATAAAVAAPLAAIWAAPATLATIASFGGAAAQAPISITAAKGLVLASSVAGFAEGGFTGEGARNRACRHRSPGRVRFSPGCSESARRRNSPRSGIHSEYPLAWSAPAPQWQQVVARVTPHRPRSSKCGF